MKVTIKHVALLMCLFLATNAAPMGNGKETGGEKEGADAGELGEAENAGEGGEGEAGEAGEMGDEVVTVNSPPPINVTTETLPNEEAETTISVTDAPTGQGAGASSSNVSEVAPNSPDKQSMLVDFNNLDKNSDGILDYKELFLGPNNFNPGPLNAAFQISDKNFDGVVDQQEFFRHPQAWGRVFPEKRATQSVDSSGTGASENFTSPPDVTPTPEQTNNASPEGTAPQLPEGNVMTTVPTAEQSSTGLMVVDEESSVSVDTSNKTIVSSNGEPHGKEPFATSQGQNEGANGKAGSPVGSKEGGVSGSKIGHPPANGYQTAASKGGVAAGSTGVQVKIATGQKVEQIPGDKKSGSQPSGVSGSFGGHRGQGGKYSQTNGQAAHAGSGVSHAAAVAGKPVGQSMSHTRTNGVQPEGKVHTAGKPHQDVHSKPAQPSWSSKPQEPAKQHYYLWDGQKWLKAYVQQGVSVYDKSKGSEYNGTGKSAGMVSFPDQKKESTEEHDTQSNEEEDNQSRNEEDKKSENENGKGDGDDESDDK